jgi:hypothetical protein
MSFLFVAFFLAIATFYEAQALVCPLGSTQIGGVNADIGGCGLEPCEARYGYNSIAECSAHCTETPNCQSFSWAPLGGDRNHVNEKACTIYSSSNPNQVWGPNQIMCSRSSVAPLYCPAGSKQIGAVNADIGGCGLESCDARYSDNSVEECSAHCTETYNCQAFTWAPLGGDRNHVTKRACTIYSSATPNQVWGPSQIMCSRSSVAPLYCPAGSNQIGGVNADVPGCGLEPCEARYDEDDVEDCSEHCAETPNCAAFTWAPLNGDQNHAGKAVCTVYSINVPTSRWAPRQVFCDYGASADGVIPLDHDPDHENEFRLMMAVQAAMAIAIVILACAVLNIYYKMWVTNNYKFSTKKVAYRSVGMSSDSETETETDR